MSKSCSFFDAHERRCILFLSTFKRSPQRCEPCGKGLGRLYGMSILDSNICVYLHLSAVSTSIIMMRFSARIPPTLAGVFCVLSTCLRVRVASVYYPRRCLYRRTAVRCQQKTSPPPSPATTTMTKPIQGCMLCKAGSLCEICAMRHVSVWNITSPSFRDKERHKRWIKHQYATERRRSYSDHVCLSVCVSVCKS